MTLKITGGLFSVRNVCLESRRYLLRPILCRRSRSPQEGSQRWSYRWVIYPIPESDSSTIKSFFSDICFKPSEPVVSDKTSSLDSGPTANPAVISSWETRSQKHKQMDQSNFVPRKRLIAGTCSIIYWSSFSTIKNRLNPFWSCRNWWLLISKK